ncbi:MAG: SapC family protein, partial [Desulfobacteraceae bacterium]
MIVINKKEEKMFKKIEPLSKEKHQDLRFDKINGYEFARNITNTPLSASEFRQAGRYYPVVFPTDGAFPMILFALNQQTNLYLNQDGSWKVPYVPAYIRRYPFVLVKSDKEEGSKENYIFCIDTEAPHFASDQGEPLFTANGDLGDVSRKALKFLEMYQSELTTTRTLCQELESKEILVGKEVSFEKEGQQTKIGGFRCVDVEKMNKLDDAVLAQWVRNGLMGLILTHLQSVENIKAFTR